MNFLVIPEKEFIHVIKCDGIASSWISYISFCVEFFRGVMGSGLCIFSRHPILSTFEHMYTLKGFAHKIFHGDWYAGKSVGLAVINVDGFLINTYITHVRIFSLNMISKWTDQKGLCYFSTWSDLINRKGSQ